MLGIEGIAAGEGLSSVAHRAGGWDCCGVFWPPVPSWYLCLTARPFFPAMQQVLDNLGSLPNATGAAELDLIFLRGIMESPIVRSLAKV